MCDKGCDNQTSPAWRTISAPWDGSGLRLAGSTPNAVRYAWSNYPQCVLFDEHALPVGPFNITVEVTQPELPYNITTDKPDAVPKAAHGQLKSDDRNVNGVQRRRLQGAELGFPAGWNGEATSPPMLWRHLSYCMCAGLQGDRSTCVTPAVGGLESTRAASPVVRGRRRLMHSPPRCGRFLLVVSGNSHSPTRATSVWRLTKGGKTGWPANASSMTSSM